MEIELKYRIDDPKTIDKIFSETVINKNKDAEAEMVPMDAVYFDTEDGALTKHNIAFRVRREGDNYVATVKWNDDVEEGLYKREELNVYVDEESINNPYISVFDQSEVEELLHSLSDGKKFIRLMEMNFVRRQIRIDNGDCICEISADIGKIICNEKSTDILELELELLSGSQDALSALGKSFADKYMLEPEGKSKFVRGYELLADK